MVPGVRFWPGAARRTGRRGPRARFGWLALALAAVALVTALPLPPSLAQPPGGNLVQSSNGQVRIFWRGNVMASGTLVAPNWAITVLHPLREPVASAYSLRFGAINDENDAADASNLRAIDRVVRGPNGADLALVHFADPVPQDTWIPEHLATQPPPRFAPARHYGWGGGHVLTRVVGTVMEPVGSRFADELRSQWPDFAADFPAGMDPMVTNADLEPGHSGGGVFVTPGVLTGVIVMDATYEHTNASGVEHTFRTTYDQPVWAYRDWILETIASDASSSGSAAGSSERRLTGVTSGDLLMSLPPPADACEESQASCPVPDPVWLPGFLLGSGNHRGTALGICVKATGNTCSFNGTSYPAGSTARMPLGPLTAPTAPGTRQVLAWCKSTNAFTSGGPAQSVLRVSFTNTDPTEAPLGYGWWDVLPDQVGTGTGQTLVNPAQLATC